MIKRILCAVLACAVPMTVGLPVLAAEQRGMLLHYSFNAMDNSGVVKDESGSGNDGKIYGDAVEEYGRIHLDGADDYIKLPDAILQNEDEVTIAINVCPEFDTLHYFTWNFGTSATEGYMFLNTSRPDAKLRFAITPASADKEQSLVSEEDIKKGTWSNVIVTIKGRDGVMYRDGVKAAEATFDIAPRELGATTQNWIGRSPYGDALMQGYIDDFRIYNYALSEEEAKALSDEYEAELNDELASALYESGIKNVIKEDITLPIEAAGAAIKWSSSNEAVISADGKVTRPKEGEYAADVTLTAEITKDKETQTKTFNVSVPPEGIGIYGLNITGERGADINPDMVGLFFEDINYAADGGLYAEMVENRSFEAMYADNKTFEPGYDGGWAWSAYSAGGGSSSLELLTEKPLNDSNTHYLRFTTTAADNGFANAAYDGLALKKDMVYHGSFYARAEAYSGGVRISAVKDGRVYAQAKIDAISGEWTKYSFDMTAAENIRGAELVIMLDKAGVVDFDMISLMPDDAVDGVFRRDLAEMLKAINPGFLRFPGGC
ncbi:MAG: LamG-like jellyroll fold domain-containing protein, partial [Candidatus Ornithomonoglobus sp.]